MGLKVKTHSHFEDGLWMALDCGIITKEMAGHLREAHQKDVDAAVFAAKMSVINAVDANLHYMRCAAKTGDR